MGIREKIKYFIRGAGRLLEICPPQKKLGDYFPHYNAKTGFEQDAQALASDLRRVGKDLENSIKKFEEQIENGNKKS